ncbi:PASTA domain-containing protein [Kribbella qitaiheensis]|uniref:PASTA domain-containing protein n=1 Tax=Kribbella qitaiheensis TaxID=1544730 RepID=UPI001FE551DB|nr:PASTA domain-containing protein [Kribbella qitaiheensis]
MLLLAANAACGSGEPAGPATVTVTNTPPPPTPTPTPTPTGASGVVPDVVGVNHQLAQDTMQAAGYFYLTEQDATGKGRLLINDRNWVVVSQLPTGGTKAPLDTKILLRSKKIGE